MFKNVLPNIKGEVTASLALACLFILMEAFTLWLIHANGYIGAIDALMKYNDIFFIFVSILSSIVGFSLSLNILTSPYIYKPTYRGFKFLNIIGLVGTVCAAATLFFFGGVAHKYVETSDMSLFEIGAFTALVLSTYIAIKLTHIVAGNIKLTNRIQKLDAQIEIFERKKANKEDETHLQNLYSLKNAVEADPTNHEHKTALDSVITINEALLRE